MRERYIIPHGRDRSAAAYYKIMDWFCRKNRKKINKNAEKIMLDLIIYGVAYRKGGEHIPFKSVRKGNP